MLIYLNTGEDINEGWERLTKAYRRHDTRAYHIRDFENVLSTCLREPLDTYQLYKDAEVEFPIPRDEQRYLSDAAFRGRIRMFELIMRESGIIGYFEKKPEEVEDRDMLSGFFKKGGMV